MASVDGLLLTVWLLAEEEREEELAAAVESAMGALLGAGYVECDHERWRFTPLGKRRGHELAHMTEHTPWPFPAGVFPPRLGVRIMRTILEGARPVLQVVHGPEDWWGFADGIGNPNGDASATTHVQHVLDIDQSLSELASLEPGFCADRDGPGEPWGVSKFSYGSS